jgi:hypothetical protein
MTVTHGLHLVKVISRQFSGFSEGQALFPAQHDTPPTDN